MNKYRITINYDKYWHQIVFGLNKYNKEDGCQMWKRLFGIGIPYHK